MGQSSTLRVALTAPSMCKSPAATSAIRGVLVILRRPSNWCCQAAVVTAGRWTITGNQIGDGCIGFPTAVGIDLAIASGNLAHGSVAIVGNNISAPATPLLYTPSSADAAVIKDNVGLDDLSVGGRGHWLLNQHIAVYVCRYYRLHWLGQPDAHHHAGWLLEPGNQDDRHLFGNRVVLPRHQLLQHLQRNATAGNLGRWNPVSNCWNLK